MMGFGSLTSTGSQQDLPSQSSCTSASTLTVADKLLQLSKAFDKRTKAVKAELIRTSDNFVSFPNAADSDGEDHLAAANRASAMPSITSLHETNSPASEYRRHLTTIDPSRTQLWGTLRRGAVDDSTFVYRLWLLMLSLTFLYNFWAISLRASFPMYQAGEDKLTAWMAMDYICDLVVFCDIVFVKPRLAFYQNGLLVYNNKILRKTYLTSTKFKLDIIAMLPLDLCYLAVGRVQPLFRLPRLLHVRYYFELFDRLDRNSTVPEIFRTLKTTIYVLMAVHLYACVYYIFSDKTGIGHDHFVYEGEPWPAYSRCFFVTFKMATRIGGQKKEPETNPERGLMALFWLIALFVEIVLLAQVREIFLSLTREDDEFGRLLGTALAYVRRYKCPVELEKKVRDWFYFKRDTQKVLDDKEVLSLLPKHLRADLAFDMYHNLLSKVSIFENCERYVLSDVVVKLKSTLFFPGDIIYKKGDVGRQMYIMERGQAEVLDDSGTVAAILSEGAVFGEQSLLSAGNTNRRNVTVRSKGYSNLFVLEKNDFQEIMQLHPNIYRRLRKKATQTKEVSVAPTAEQKVTGMASAQPIVNVFEKVQRSTTPKILKLMMKILPGRSKLIRKMMKVHPITSIGSETESNSDFDAELARLQWSSPSPDNFYVLKDWEAKHYKAPKDEIALKKLNSTESSLYSDVFLDNSKASMNNDFSSFKSNADGNVSFIQLKTVKTSINHDAVDQKPPAISNRQRKREKKNVNTSRSLSALE